MIDIVENDLMVSASLDLCAEWYNNHTSTSRGFDMQAIQCWFALISFVQEKKTTIIVVGDGPVSKTAMCLCRLGFAHIVSVDPECITSNAKHIPEGCEEWLTLPNLTISPTRVQTMQFPIPTQDFVILSLRAHVELQKYLHKFPTPNVVITFECGCVPQTLTSEECFEYHLQPLPIHGNKWGYLKRWVKKENK